MANAVKSSDGRSKARSLESRYMRRLQRLVEKLIRAKFETAEELWQLELDLLCLQQDVQQAITEIRKQEKFVHDQLSALRNVRWNARRFGDAIAWLIFGSNRQLLYPLSDNEQVPISQKDHGSRGMVSIAGYLASQGWGFPVIHDITHSLRIGDVTFIRSDRETCTIEVKTKLADIQPTSDGQTMMQYKVSIVSAHDFRDLPISAAETNGVESGDNLRIFNSPRARVERQLSRLGSAKIQQEAEHDVLTRVPGGNPVLAASIPSIENGYFAAFKRAVRKARANGYAIESACDAITYVAVYDKTGEIDNPLAGQLGDEELRRHLKPLPELGELNELRIATIPPPETHNAHNFTPYFLYSLPKIAILDMLHGRLVVLVLINTGYAVKVLREHGYEVTARPNGKGSAPRFSIASTVTDSKGRKMRVENSNFDMRINEIVYEFESMDSLPMVAEKVFDTAKLAFEAEMTSRGDNQKP